VGLRADVAPQPWRDRADYQEGESGDYLANAIASTAGEPKGTSAGDLSVRRPAEREIRREFGANGVLVREAGDPESGVDSAAAWVVRPFPHPPLYPLVRRTLLRIAADSGRFGIVPSEDWDGGVDPWTAPTAWTAWGLAVLDERRVALHLMATLRRVATPAGFLPERVDARTGIPTSTTPLAWSHAFAILALRQLWP
jgi:GH15 family glucan-1,4-alpha-glucosidase